MNRTKIGMPNWTPKMIRYCSSAVVVAATLFTPQLSRASDHDDGETSFKARNLNLTDLYAFREDWQDSAGSADNLVLVMNTNPRSLAQFQYEFNTVASYDFNLSRVLDANKTKAPEGPRDINIRFTFGNLDENGRQSIRMRLAVKGRRTFNRVIGTTSTLADSQAGSLVINRASVRDSTVQVFAGLREDPFFFDVERYFRIRSFLATGNNTLGSGPIQGGPNVFRSDSTAVDFTVGYNVNSIVVSIPLALLRENSGQNVFDVWETISIPELVSPSANTAGTINGRNNRPTKQIERLARPAINEGLVLTNRRLAMFNELNPRQDLLKRNETVLAEVVAVLTAVFQYSVANGLNPAPVSQVAAGFLPDVMRIDTSKSVAVNTAAYNSDFVLVDGAVQGAMLTGGRKLEDDVVDVTLSYLLNGDPSGASVKDGITYGGGTTCTTAGQGSNPGNPGHRCLNGQTQRLGSATFPFLAAPQ